MYEQRAIVVRQVGQRNEIAEKISEGIWEAEARRLQAEVDMLRAQLAEAEARVGVFNWGYQEQKLRRLRAECELDKRKASIWSRIFALI